jgi:Cu-Zn family superoxide dismutase
MRNVLIALTAVAALSACSTFATGPQAVTKLEPTKGNAVTGTVRFQQMGDKVQVSGDVRGLKPNSEHGFHVHEKGDCSSGDGMSAGGHFNPGGKPHSHQGTTERHAGDLPNLKANGEGVATFSLTTPLLSVGSGAANVIGRSVIVHRDPDDYSSQPAGNSGPRVACGVIVAG